MKKNSSFDSLISQLIDPVAKGHLHATRTVTIQVTDACNLACTYCYQINKAHHVLPVEYGEKFIDDLLDGKYNKYANYDKSEAIILEFIGGEPFLEIDLVSHLTDYFIQGLIKRNHPWRNRYRISICSNGTLYFDPKVQFYIKEHFDHLSFSISIDGNKKLHDTCRVFPTGEGSYDRAIAAVNHYRENGGFIGSKMTLAPENIEYTYEAVKNLIENDYNDIYLNCVYEEGWTLNHAKILYKQLKLIADYLLENNLWDKIALSIFDERYFMPKNEEDMKNWCGGAGDMLAIDYKGDLYPCIRFMESSLGTKTKPIIIGNVNTGIMSNKHECDNVSCLQCITRRSQSTDECFYCPIAEGCSWCTAYNYQVFGTPDARATFICTMHKARALANAYYWNKIYRIAEPTKRFRIWIPENWALEIIDEDEWNFLKWLESSNILL